jgi:hypothetical protein
MMRALNWLVLAGALLAVSGSVAAEGRASRVWAPDTRVNAVEIVADKSDPTSFTMLVKREMPTPGWTFLVDSVEADTGASRLTVKLTEVGPDGIVAQVLTPAQIEIPLGQVAPGAYFVELWTRRSPAKPHQPGHALVILAR